MTTNDFAFVAHLLYRRAYLHLKLPPSSTNKLVATDALSTSICL
ncbi:hypothetical protein HMPREF3232_01251 [Fannyhessea vaginae]|nr:hypothetical protein HMPREF3232_01251 [Fannyhessea vaginae]